MAKSNGNRFDFLSVLGHSNIGHDLRLDGQYTLFAPTDNAFKNLDPQLLNRITTDQRCLKSMYLQMHPCIRFKSAAFSSNENHKL